MFFYLPVDALNNVISFRIGKPEYIKMKDSEYFRAIQNKYRIKCTEPRVRRSYIDRNCRKAITSSYSIVRDVPFKIEKHQTYHTKAKRRIVEFAL